MGEDRPVARDASRVLDEILETPLDDSDVSTIRDMLSRGGGVEFGDRIAQLLREFSVLAEVSKTVGNSTSLDVMLPHLITVIIDVLHAERGTLFLYDRQSRELFSRVLRGGNVSEIRIGDDVGIAGDVFTRCLPAIVEDAYADPRFNREIDKQTGFRTRNILCAPVRNRSGEVIGVTQILNKIEGKFDDADAALLNLMTTQAAAALEHARYVEELEKAHRDEVVLLEVGGAVSGDLDLDTLLEKIMQAATTLTNAERSTLFIHDPETGELWSRVVQGTEGSEIRLPSYVGLAGAAFITGETLNIDDPYSDSRFDPTFDRESGFETRSILCMPLIDRLGHPVGVMQVLNKIGGAFSTLDEIRLKAFSAQATVALENANLFQDVLKLKNYNESILKSLSNGVITLDRAFTITKINDAAQRILASDESDLIGRPLRQIFSNTNDWILNSLEYVAKTGGSDFHADADLRRHDSSIVSVNLTVTPLRDIQAEPLGYLLVLEDLTREKRIRITMSRYLAKDVVDKLLEHDADAFSAAAQQVSVLFSDIRRFAEITDSLGVDETVHMLNSFFSEMVDVVLRKGGIVDKYIGDAIMAVYGAPMDDPQNADHAVATAIEMVAALQKFNHDRTSRGFDPISLGIGISSGEVVAGSIGTAKRMDYTVIGQCVNLAARIESANKHYGTNVLVSENTIAKLKIALSWREIDLVRLSGTRTPIAIYEPLDTYAPAIRTALSRVRDSYQRGLRCYRQRSWNQARSYFEQVIDRCPNDVPSQLYINRCNYYNDNPPSDDWDGVWILEK